MSSGDLSTFPQRNSRLVQLLQAVQDCDLASVEEKLHFINSELLNARCGAQQITALQLACSLPTETSLPFAICLISHGANVSSKDKLGRTPLYYAASNGSLELVQLLLDHGAEINAISKSPPRTLEFLEDGGVSNHLPAPKFRDRTPLHEAVKGNHKDIVELLLERKVSVHIEDNNRVPPLLLAGTEIKESNLTIYEDIVSLLIQHGADVNVKSYFPGNTALHQAVALNSLEATNALIAAGATIKDNSYGQTPLHEAARRGNYSILDKLLACESDLINAIDKIGCTALHKAAYAGSEDCIQLLIQRGGDLSMKIGTNTSVMDVIFSHMPKPLNFLKDVLNTKITCHNDSVNNGEFKMKIDFEMLIPEENDKQMSVITSMVQAGQTHESLELLQHPVLETFLHLKYMRLYIFFYSLVFVHGLFVFSLSAYVIFINHEPPYSEGFFNMAKIFLFITGIVLFVYPAIQCFLFPSKYWKKIDIWLNLFCGIFSLVVLINGNKLLECNKKVPTDWAVCICSIVILLAWIELMHIIGKFLPCGYHAAMFFLVLRNILKIIPTFVCLVIGFALSFSVQFRTLEQFQDPWRALVKTIVMMMGEFEYADLFADKSDNEQHMRLPVTSTIIFLMFIILVSIVLLNLMVGLTVNDIQSLEKKGHVKRLEKQCMFLSEFEIFFSHKYLKGFFDKWQTLEKKYWLGPDLQSPGIPMNILESIIKVAIDNKNSNTNYIHQHLEDEMQELKGRISEIISNLSH